uniref:Oxidation resistance protein 1 n=1 Tax=Schistocephalus solidus TaxID=70667 RepID=A0A0X3P3L1_SCHSO
MKALNSEVSNGIYIVQAGDSLMSIAARFGNITPAQLARFNKLGMLGVGQPPLFPGQKLYVPSPEEMAAQNVRLRHFPGAATRVNALTADFSGTDHHATNQGVFSTPASNVPRSASIHVPANSDRKLSETQADVMERLFVKTPARRILHLSKTPVDGILIVTPDAVCFDALATASELSEAPTAMKEIPKSTTAPTSSPTATSISSSEDVNAAFVLPSEAGLARQRDSGRDIEMLPLEPLIAQPALSAEGPMQATCLGVCIPIPSLVSLNTHKNLNELLVRRGAKPPSRLSDDGDDRVNIGNVIRVEPPSSDTCVGRPKVAADASTELGISNEALLADESASTDSNLVYISIGVDPTRILQSSSPSETMIEATSSNSHIFEIPLERLGDIHDILVSATNLAYSQKLSMSPKSESGVRSRDPNIRQSIVEKALDDMEAVPFELSLGEATSVILDDQMLHDLSQGLPLHWVGYGMRLVFSTDHDGFSLNSLYRKTEEVKNVVLLLIRDTTNTAFGAVLSERMRCSLHFYGTGESCVFHWKPAFKRYDWTKKNYFFMRGAPDCFLIGAQSGHSAIWFDESLKYGRSEATDTFDNPVLCGQSRHAAKGIIHRTPSNKSLQPNDVRPSSVPFIIDQLEVWEMFT